MADLHRTIRTIRHLRCSQMLYRARYIWERRRRPVLGNTPGEIVVRSDAGGLQSLLCQHEPRRIPEDLLQGSVAQFHLPVRLGTESIDWHLGPQCRNRLNVLGLHSHRWLWELGQLACAQGPQQVRAESLTRAYLADWIGRCDISMPGARDLAWNAYAIAARLGWWARLYHALGETGRRTWGELERSFLESFWRQATYLHGHLEWDLRGNHLLRDAVGLAWAGRFFAGDTPQRWLKAAAQLAVQQVDEQILPDGGHFERSPMYHVHVMEDILQLAVLLEDASARNCLVRAWQRMAEFLCWVQHDDGRIPLLNDGGMNGCGDPACVLNEGHRHLSVTFASVRTGGGKLFQDFGLIVWRGDPWTVFFDVGAIGPDYQPGHAHADSLAIECSYRGHRLFVDPGTYAYDMDDRRRYDRSTAAHNTVCIDGTDSSEVWHIFRVGRRALPMDVEMTSTPGLLRASASHNGYDHLPGCPRHTRVVTVDNKGELTVVDRISGGGEHHVESGLLVAPGWRVHPTAEGWCLERGACRVQVVLQGEHLEKSIEQRPYHPEYGLEVQTNRLHWAGKVRLPFEITCRVSDWGKDHRKSVV